MCGIAGVMTKNGLPPDVGILDRLERALDHRGPDGSGRHLNADTAIVQTRLAIIDLATGDQPFVVGRPDGATRALVANGEIYNYRELYDQLPGVRLATSSDCEPPLHLYDRNGVSYADGLRGMYAIAIHDGSLGQLVLSRDPFGIKPLYYTQTADKFAFASEPQALIRAGICIPSENAAALHELFQLQFTCGRETPFSGIFRVLPGETIVVRQGVIVERLHRPALPMAGPEKISADAAAVRFDRLFQQSVELHQRADVPYGMFLSGGIDSSALLAMMRRLNNNPVQTFTTGFDGTDVHDERAHARRVAKAVGADYTEVSFDESDFWNLLPEVTRVVDDPCADYATLPTYKLARAVRHAGLKVVLGGEGGDELFAGYGRYRRATRRRVFGGRGMRSVGQLDGLGILRQSNRDWRRRISRTERDLPTSLSGLQRAQAVDCAHWLPNDLLTKLDRCLMAHGVEGRVPFIDPALAAFAYRLPDALKVNGGRGKWLLRQWLDGALPESAAFSKKRGFTVPVGAWLSARGPALGPLVAAQPGVARYCDPDAVRRVFAASGKQAAQAQWVLLFFALWHGHYFEGKAAEGDVFDVLAA